MQKEISKCLAIDFDGTIAKYDGFKGKGVFGCPIAKTAKTLSQMKKDGWRIIIYTTRSETGAVKSYLEHHRIPFDYINYNPDNIDLGLSLGKPRADFYIDDRAVRFQGDWELTYAQIKKLREEKDHVKSREENAKTFTKEKN